MNSILQVSQIVISIALIIAILLQQRGDGLGSAFGSGGEFYGTKRGIQKKLFVATIVLGALFIILGVLNLIF